MFFCKKQVFLILIFFVAVAHSPKSRLIQLKKEKLEYTPGEHEHGLFPAPIHVGGYFLRVSVVGKQAPHVGDGEVGWPGSAVSPPRSLFAVFILSPCQVTHVFQRLNFAKGRTQLAVLCSAKVLLERLFFLLHELCSPFLFTIRKYQSNLKPAVTARILLLKCSTEVSSSN